MRQRQTRKVLDAKVDYIARNIIITCAHEDAGTDRGDGMQASCYARGAHANY